MKLAPCRFIPGLHTRTRPKSRAQPLRRRLQLTVKPPVRSLGFHRINEIGHSLVNVLARRALKPADIEARAAGRNSGQHLFCLAAGTLRSGMVVHVARLDQAGALQNSQSPVVAVVGGDGSIVKPPLDSALVNMAHISKKLICAACFNLYALALQAERPRRCALGAGSAPGSSVETSPWAWQQRSVRADHIPFSSAVLFCSLL
jgi:hypothetical protein